jgi:hypothetical protein
MTFETAIAPVGLRSPELSGLLEPIAVAAADRERDRVAPYEQIGWCVRRS